MRQQQYIAPEIELTGFNCPHCGVYAKQHWYALYGFGQSVNAHRIPESQVAVCDHCGKSTIWCQQSMVFPDHGPAEPPSLDLPEDIRRDYLEAGSIVTKSPRGAAALLRLAIQKLCEHLGQPGKDINSDIKALVSQGLPARVQQALDSARVIGNNAVHPGEIDLRDDVQMAIKLFRLINFVAAKMISEPQEINDIYAGLPEGKRKAIDQRDGRT